MVYRKAKVHKSNCLCRELYCTSFNCPCTNHVVH